MLAKIAPRFVISGVIQNAYYANYMAMELTKQAIGNRGLSFKLEDPKQFYECNFFGYLTTQARPTEFTSQYQAEKYDEAVKKFALYNEIKNIFDQLNDFTLEIKEIYRVIEANNTSSNFFARSNNSTQVKMKAWEADLHDCIDRYNAFLDQLEPYPEWRTKIIDETGKWFLMIHNNLGESQTKLDIFAKLNRQEYFV